MQQQFKLNIHFFDFKHLHKSTAKNFKLRFSILSESIPEQKMIKGSQPLAGYFPKEFRISEIFSSNSSCLPNQIYSFDLTRNYDIMREIKDIYKQRKNKLLILVVELFVQCKKNSQMDKAFSSDENGFVNIGHNMLRISSLGNEVHETVQVVFDEVLFCSVGLAVHIQTLGINFQKNKSLKKKKSILIWEYIWIFELKDLNYINLFRIKLI